ncbi:glutamine--fructose-6-phosphate transaminase (isomerizing) [Candidatus Woesearchaeota archaeon]|nr:glutamine--fructose-6-phosphate transaminase (isomerizing) [Candidatus Woesearchaeota archaeon]
MCGITAYYGKQKAGKILLDMIQHLEYRGYDSVGMATLSSHKLFLKKGIGRIAQVDARLHFSEMPGTKGIAHTRWATHGGVTDENAHPHVDEESTIAVVHNGIIENYQQLRAELEKKRHRFASQTDTEVIVHLIEEYARENSFLDAVKKTLARLEGNYALAILSTKTDVLIAARNGSPLVLGIGNGEFFLASDAPAFLGYTKDVIFLDDHELVVINGSWEVINTLTNSVVKKEVQQLLWSADQAKKGDYPHFMLKEISEQSTTLHGSLLQDERLLQQVVAEINRADHIFLVACGSAYHAALTASYVFAQIGRKHVDVVYASEFMHVQPFITSTSVVIPVSQSGETADVLEAVKLAKEKGATIISIINVMGSSLMRASDRTLLINAGPEICVLATKSFTAQLTLLTLLAYACAGKLQEGKDVLLHLAISIGDMLRKEYRTRIETVADRLVSSKDIFVIGRSSLYPLALEAALKIKEVSYIHAEGFAGGELKHGSIALIEEGTPCIAFVGNDAGKEATLSNAMEVKSRGGFIIGVAVTDNEIFDVWLPVPSAGDIVSLAHIIPIQLLAYFLAVKRGVDPDFPRNLAKCVTVK